MIRIQNENISDFYSFLIATGKFFFALHQHCKPVVRLEEAELHGGSKKSLT